MPRAVLDVGSNTIRLLVADVKEGRVCSVLDRSEFVRLGRGVDSSGRLSDDRMDAGVEAIRRLSSVAAEQGAVDLRAIATSAVREATNGAAFVRRVHDETGVEVQIISGDEEASLTFRGATLGINLEGGALIVDLGGGSAEVIYATEEGMCWQRSEPLGSGRLSERFLPGDPPDGADMRRLRAYIREQLERLPPVEAHLAIFTGGTATNVALVAGRKGDLIELEPRDLEHVLQLLGATPAADIAERYKIRPERAEVLPAGAGTLGEIARFYRVERIMITRQGMREGALLG